MMTKRNIKEDEGVANQVDDDENETIWEEDLTKTMDSTYPRHLDDEVAGDFLTQYLKPC